MINAMRPYLKFFILLLVSVIISIYVLEWAMKNGLWEYWKKSPFRYAAWALIVFWVTFWIRRSLRKRKQKSLNVDECFTANVKKQDIKLEWETSYDFEPESKRYPGKVDVDIVVDNSQHEEWLASLTEEERTEYYNKQCKKGEANL